MSKKGKLMLPQKKMLKSFEKALLYEQENIRNCYNPPGAILFDPREEGAFFFGRVNDKYLGDAKTSWGFLLSGRLRSFVGKRQDYDGHVGVFGGSGSGKSSCLAIPSILTWRGPIFAIDLKGELIAMAGKNGRKSKILYMVRGQKNAFHCEPFYLLRNDGEENLVQNARELANAIIPLPTNDDSGRFWINSARDILAGAIVYYSTLKTSFGFIDTMIVIKITPMSELLKIISKNEVAKACINPDIEMTPKTLAGISAELHIHIAVFATDPMIQDVLSPSEETEAIRWEDIENGDIFIRIDQSKLGQWGGVIRMMLTQMTRTLERRPEKYSSEGANLKPTLLMLDEFPQYGKIEIITLALRILRSKNVTLALFCQSIADLDEIYGHNTRRVIMDGCSYKAILNAADAETQEYFSKLVGTARVPMRGISASYDHQGQPLGYSGNVTESREYIIQPHEFASLQDIVLLHPEGFCRVEKVPYYSERF